MGNVTLPVGSKREQLDSCASINQQAMHATFLYELGRRFQRIAGFLLLMVLVGLPVAIIAPRQSGLVLLVAIFLALLVKLARRNGQRTG
jgi:hypothetical protein